MMKDKLVTAVHNTANRAKTAALVTIPVAAGALCPLVSFAAETGASSDIFESVSQSMLTSIESLAASMGSLIASIIPTAFPIVSLGFLVTIGLSTLRKLVRQA